MQRSGKRGWAAFAAACIVWLTAAAAIAAPFTPGNLVVYRVGNGSAALIAGGNPVFLDEYTTAGALVQSIAMPTTGSAGVQKALLASGTATSDGFLTRSANGNCLVLPGYARDLGSTSALTGTTGATVPRVVGRVMASGAVDTSTALTDASSSANFRGTASADCNSFWVTGSAGVRYAAALGATTSTDITNALPAATRTVAIYGGQLYIVSNSTPVKGVSAVGSGMPTTAIQTVSRLPGLTDALTPSNYQFFFAALGGAGVDTLYVADDTNGAGGGISKFSLNAGTWVARGTVGTAADAYRGLTGIVSGSTVTLFAIRKNAAAGGGEMVSITDASGYNGTLSAAPSAALATAGTNQAFRGIALAPEVTVTPSAGPNGSISPATPQIVAAGATPSFTVTANPGYTALVGGTCNGSLQGNLYTTNAVSVNCTVSATFTQQVTHTVTPSVAGSGAISPDTPQTVVEGQTRDFIVTPAAGYSVAVGGSCGGNLQGNTFTTAPVLGDCTVIATFTLITHTVTPSAGAHGTINPDTPQVVPAGQKAIFTVTPDSGYSADVGGTCGGGLVGTTYTTNAVTMDCTVSATFAPLPTFTVTPSVGAHGSVTPNLAQTIVQGSTASFTIAPDAGYNTAVRGTCGGSRSGNVYTTNAITADCTVEFRFSTKLVLFQGNSYTFGRINPVMQYNTDNVTDLTHAMWVANPTGSNEDEPHPWGGIPGVFKKFTEQAGLDYDVSISARNAASMRGHFLNSNPANWDLRGNVASQKWDVVVLQDLSDEPLPAGRSANANLPYFDKYADKFEAWIHVGASETYTETQLFGNGSTAVCQSVTGASASACNTTRTISPANTNANPATDIYLYQTWARPDMIAPNGTNVNGTYYTAAEGLEAMTADFHNAYFGRFAANGNFKGVSPVGDAFLRAVVEGVAMRDPYMPEAGKINLWHTDFFHPSKYGSYLSALVHFARITGIDPTSLGAGELAAIDLGIATGDAVSLQQIAKLTVSPAAPIIGSATEGDAQITVTFSAPSNVGYLPITGYTVDCGGTTASGAGSPITVTGLANGAAQSCTVKATNSVGSSVASDASNGVTPAGLPGAPVIGTAIASNMQIDVAFAAPLSNGGSDIVSYTATCGGQSASGAASPISVGGLSNFTSYTCTVTATNGVGTGPSSNVSNSVTPGPTPTVTSLVRADASPTNADTVHYTLTFSEPVTGLALSNLSLTPLGITGASISTIEGSDATYTVTVDTGSGSGTLTLFVSNGGGVTNATGQTLGGVLPASGETYTIDKGGTVVGSGMGQPDAAFGNSGYALFSSAERATSPGSIAVLADGRILVAGGVACDPDTGADCTLQLARYLANGAPDTGFAPGGRVLASISGIHPELSALIVNSDGTFFVTGSRRSGAATVPFVASFAGNGTPVAGYGANGLASLPGLSLVSPVIGTALDGEGRMMAAGTRPGAAGQGSDVFVARLTLTGALDPGFGDGGVASFGISDFGARNDVGTDVEVQPNGRILVGGHTQGANGFDFLLLRLKPNGMRDNGFAQSGIATARFAGSDGDNAGRKLALQPDGRIVMVGPVAVGGSNQCGVARFNQDGTPDASFGVNGQALIPLTQGCLRVTLQADGKVIVAAMDRSGAVTFAAYARLLSNGMPDTGFGDNGVLDISSYAAATEVAPTASGSLLSGLVIQDPADGVFKSYVVQLGSQPALATTTAITSIAPSPALTGQAYTVAVTVTSASGTPSGLVMVSDGAGSGCTATLAAGSGSCSLSSATAGKKTITASYVPTSGYGASTAAKAQTINSAKTATTLVASVNPVLAGTPVTLTATVLATSAGATTPTGSVTFKSGGATLGTGTLNASGVAMLEVSLAAGTYNVTANYGGNGDYFDASKSAVLALKVRKN